MSVSYRPIQWNAHKRVYDLLIASGIAAYIGIFLVVSIIAQPEDRRVSLPILLMRATATCAFLMLHLILCIGPLCRLDRRFLPLLYNRRHLGVSMFLVALTHAILAIGFYHGFGTWFPPASVLAGNTQYQSPTAFPFESLGIVALLILFLMAATSHDFWLKFLTPRIWKYLHLTVYAAYALLVGHVMLGALQSEWNAVYFGLTILGAIVVCALHLLAATREAKRDNGRDNSAWLDAGPLATLMDGRGRSVSGAGERIAVFRFGNRVSAMSNVCAHQGGPIGEGRIVGGCVTCPWHGYQYRPEDACSPPPFTEKLPTYPVRIEHGRVFVRTEALPPGTDASVSVNQENNHVRHG